MSEWVWTIDGDCVEPSVEVGGPIRVVPESRALIAERVRQLLDRALEALDEAAPFTGDTTAKVVSEIRVELAELEDIDR